jgi:hypothetical protein
MRRAGMSRITRALIFSMVCAAMVIPAYQFASACQVDEFYHTNEGALAASTLETLITAIKFQEAGNKEKLADLIKSGKVLRLAGNIKVHVLERSFEFKMLKITLPDEKVPYWVKDGSLKQITCN